MGQQFDTIIIGTGIAGLAAGNYLAAEGHHVLLVEKNGNVGGYCTSFVDEGFLFDGAATMISSIGKLGYVEKAFQAMDLSYAEKLVSLPTFETVIISGEKFVIPAKFADFIQMLKERFPEDAAGIDQFLSLAEQIYAEAEQINSWTYPILKNVQLFPKTYPIIFREKNTFLEEVLERYFINGTLKNLFRAQCFRLGLVPETTSLINFVGPWFYTYFTPPAYFTGGVGSISQIMEKGIRQKGGTILTNAECTKILIEDGKAVGIQLANGDTYTAKQVISNMDALKTFYNLVGQEHLKKAFISKLERMQISPSAFLLYLGLDCHPREVGMEEGDLWHFEKLRAETTSEEKNYGWNQLYISSPTVKAGSKNGKHSLMIIKTVPYHDAEYWQSGKESFLKEILSYTEKILPGLHDHIVYLKCATPVDLEQITGNTQGAVGGWAPIPSQSGFLRLTRETPIENLFITGHWTGPGSGITAVVASGMKVGQMILTERS